jgi:hypothetical protein
MGVPLTMVERTVHEYALHAARAKLGEGTFEEAWARGHAMPLEEAISSTVEDEGPNRADRT